MGSSERAIENTDNDALEAKAYAIKLGYWKDSFIKYFITDIKSKAPEISRGYFVRCQMIETVVKKFIMSNPDGQIINLGAGSDTMYFRLMEQNIHPKKFVEIDLLENVMKKIHFYQMRKIFCDKLKLTDVEKQSEPHRIAKDPYYLLPIDLRQKPTAIVDQLQNEAGLQLNCATLFVAECVFVYIDNTTIDSLLAHFCLVYPNSVVVSYDLINMTDAFSTVMVQNLKMRNIELRGLTACFDRSTHIKRFQTAGYKLVNVWSISEAYKALSQDTIRRLASIEMLDDPEMMQHMFSHYCFVLALNDSSQLGVAEPEEVLQHLVGAIR